MLMKFKMLLRPFLNFTSCLCVNFFFSYLDKEWSPRVCLDEIYQLPFTCSKLKIETLEQRRSGVFIVNFEHIPHLILVFLLFILNR